MRILLVDDDQVTGQLLTKILSKQGYDVVHMTDGGQALEAARTGQYKIIMTDWMMPGMDGLSLCRHIRQLDLAQYIYIILLTAKNSKDDAVTGLESGADDFIVKPFDKFELLARIRAGRRLVELEDSQRETLLKLSRSEKMAAVGHLAAGVAHEINNPIGFISSNLNALQGYLDDMRSMLACYRRLTAALDQSISQGHTVADLPEIIKKSMDMEKNYEIDFVMQDSGDLIKDCSAGASRIRSIVHEMRYFAHPEKQQYRPDSLSRILRKALAGFASQQLQAVEVQEDLNRLPEIACNAPHIEQAFTNILRNAFEALDGGGRIVVEGRCDGKNVEIVISDSGRGIPVENLSLVFNPFFTTKEVGQGVGMGLTTALNIVKMHNGTITYHSTPDRQTAFTITLPIGDVVN